MAKITGLSLGVVALLALAVTGCGKTNLASVAPGTNARMFAPTSTAIQGVERKFGYDYLKYETVGSRVAHPRHIVRQGILRGSVDNRDTCSPVADQGQLGACTAFSMGKGLSEQIQIKNHGDTAALSPLFLYYVERDIEGTTATDSGAMISDGIKALTDTGIAHESSFPYDVAKFSVKPPQAAYDEAANLKLHDAVNLANLDDVKTALNAGQTVAFGFKVYASFKTITSNGLMPVPKASEKVLGGHAILAVGYDDTKQVLIVRNSWGPSWGDKGYFYMPYKVATNDAMVHEFYTASK